MRTTLTYTHSRNLFAKNEFKPFVKKYFKDVVFLGFECGYWGPSISISNWEDIKESLPKSYKPTEVE